MLPKPVNTIDPEAPQAFSIAHYHLAFSLSADGLTLKNTFLAKRTDAASNAPLILNGSTCHQIYSMTLNGKQLKVRDYLSEDRCTLVIRAVGNTFNIVILSNVLIYSNKQWHGVRKSVFPADILKPLHLENIDILTLPQLYDSAPENYHNDIRALYSENPADFLTGSQLGLLASLPSDIVTPLFVKKNEPDLTDQPSRVEEKLSQWGGRQSFRHLAWGIDHPGQRSLFTTTFKATLAQIPFLHAAGNKQAIVQNRRKMCTSSFTTLKSISPHQYCIFGGSLSKASSTINLGAKSISVNLFAPAALHSQLAVAQGVIHKAIQYADQLGLEHPKDVPINVFSSANTTLPGTMNSNILHLRDHEFYCDSAYTTDENYRALKLSIHRHIAYTWYGEGEKGIRINDWQNAWMSEGLSILHAQLALEHLEPNSCSAVDRFQALMQGHFGHHNSSRAQPVIPDDTGSNESIPESMPLYTAELFRMLSSFQNPQSSAANLIANFSKEYMGRTVSLKDYQLYISPQLSDPVRNMSKWFANTGSTRVYTEQKWEPDTGTYTLTFSQSSQNAQQNMITPPRPVSICFAIYDDGMKKIARGRSILVLTSQKITVIIPKMKGNPSSPTPALFINMSAPVLSTSNLKPEQYIKLFIYAEDPFVRYKAIYEYLHRQVSGLLGSETSFAEDAHRCFSDAFERWGKDDLLLFSKCLTVLSLESIKTEVLVSVDPRHCLQCIELFYRELADRLPVSIEQWRVAASNANDDFEPKSIAKRALHSVLLKAKLMKRHLLCFNMYDHAQSNTLYGGHFEISTLLDTMNISRLNEELHSQQLETFEKLAPVGSLKRMHYLRFFATPNLIETDAAFAQRLRRVLTSAALVNYRNPQEVSAFFGGLQQYSSFFSKTAEITSLIRDAILGCYKESYIDAAQAILEQSGLLEWEKMPEYHRENLLLCWCQLSNMKHRQSALFSDTLNLVLAHYFIAHQKELQTLLQIETPIALEGSTLDLIAVRLSQKLRGKHLLDSAKRIQQASQAKPPPPAVTFLARAQSIQRAQPVVNNEETPPCAKKARVVRNT